jgi:hypothetical protein
MITRSTPHRPRARRALAALATLAAVALTAGCASAAATSTRATTTTAAATTDGASSTDRPSTQTRMICAPEAQEDLAKTLGLATVAPPVPVWRAGVYSCNYGYANGSFTLSVRQLPDPAHAGAAANVLARQLSSRTELQGLGARAFTTASGGVVVQKDNDVLVVDVLRLPDRFGVPADTRANAAISIAATIMGCWTGA